MGEVQIKSQALHDHKISENIKTQNSSGQIQPLFHVFFWYVSYFFPSSNSAPCLPRAFRAIHRGTTRCLRLLSCTLLSTKALGLCPTKKCQENFCLCFFGWSFCDVSHAFLFLAYWVWYILMVSLCGFGEKLLCFKVCVWTASASKRFQIFHHSAMHNSQVLSRTDSQYSKSTTLKEKHRDHGIFTKSKTSEVLRTAALHLYGGLASAHIFAKGFAGADAACSACLVALT